MSKELQHLEEIRDWVAHGVWSLDKPFPRLQISSGSWQPPGHHKPVSSKVIPAAAQVNHETLRGVAIIGLELLQLLERFHFQLQAQQRASPEKQPEELHRRPSRQQHRN